MQILNRFLKKKTVSKGLIGISFLHGGIALAICRFGENDRLVLVDCEFLESKPADQPDVLDAWLVARELDGYDGYLVLTGDHYRRVNIEALALAENEIIDAIRWQIAELIDFPPDKAVIDYYPAPAGIRANSVKMFEVVASPLEVVREQVDRCVRAKLEIKVIDIQETSLRNLAVQLSENERGVGLLYLTESSGILMIEKEAVIYVFRKFEIGYKRLGLEESFSRESPFINVHNNLALEIQRSLDYAESYYGIPPVSTLAVVPLPENTHNLLDSLSSNLGVTVRMIDLSSLVDTDIVLNSRTQSYCAPVIGVMLRNTIES